MIRITIPPSEVTTVLYVEGERVTRTEWPGVTLATLELVASVNVERLEPTT